MKRLEFQIIIYIKPPEKIISLTIKTDTYAQFELNENTQWKWKFRDHKITQLLQKLKFF